MPVSGLLTLKRKIAAERGLDCDQLRPSFFLRRVQTRLRHTGEPTIRDYIRLLDRDTEEYVRLVEALCINVTQFFRNDSTFRVIRREILPTLIATSTGTQRKTLRVWSAGCSTGQEAYSLAILLAEARERRPEALTARVYGTDIDPRAVAYARRGVYGPREIEGVAGAYALRHFVTNGHYQVAPPVRELVRFRLHDLLKDPPLRHVDLLVCRNVLIYFSSARRLRRRLFDLFYAALRPGGFLVLGKTEAVGPEVKGRFIPFDAKELVYQKVAATAGFDGGPSRWLRP